MSCKIVSGIGIIALVSVSLVAQEKTAVPILKFERVRLRGDVSSSADQMFRARVANGWLVTTDASIQDRAGAGLTFVPDPRHVWNADSTNKRAANQQSRGNAARRSSRTLASAAEKDSEVELSDGDKSSTAVKS